MIVEPNLQVRHLVAGIVSPDRLHGIVKIVWNQGREVEVTVSPTGRSVRVYLDGQQMEVPDDKGCR